MREPFFGLYLPLVSIVVPSSGYYLANRLGRILFDSMEECLGRNGLNALLNLSGLGNYITAPPADDLALGFDIAAVSNLNRALEMVYGPRGGRGLALRGGRAMYDRLMAVFDLPTGINDLAFRLLPVQTKLKMGLPAFAKLISQHSDLACRVADRGAHFDYVVDRSPDCWGREAKTPSCHLTAGLLLEAASALGRGQEFRVVETECRATGATACVFRIEKEPIA